MATLAPDSTALQAECSCPDEVSRPEPCGPYLTLPDGSPFDGFTAQESPQPVILSQCLTVNTWRNPPAPLSGPTDNATGWLENLQTTGTIARLNNRRDGSNPAVQPTIATQPTANSDASILFGPPVKLLLLPITSQNYGSRYWWMALWLKTPLSTVNRAIYRIINVAGGADVASILFQVSSNENLSADVTLAPGQIRRASGPAGGIGDNTPQFVTCEFNGDFEVESKRFVLTNNTVPSTLVFSNQSGTPNAMPRNLVAASGNAVIGSNSADGAGTTSFTGTFGTDIWFGTTKVGNPTEGCLPKNVRAGLRDYRPLS